MSNQFTMSKQLTEFMSIVEQATPAERTEIVTILLQRVESRENEVYELCKANPKHLQNLSAEKLQRMAIIAECEAHAFFVSALPNALDMLIAFEGLNLFTSLDLDKKALTVYELTCAIEDIETVWKEAGGSRAVDLLTWRANLADIPMEKVSARARRSMDSRRPSKAKADAPAKG